ncbi:hypothetical protein LMG26857_03362 [Achromobacter anxifer]|uniref:DoxX family protein n=1 Tax=Achromobacter anxifer TaxID=1287737 RepID=UPI00155C124F|nr:DoxX family protein [Achromobacter anxifer]CAB5514303.1 hypothetical protein LMG26857_03362 [Achromobacter anxifer]
MNFFNKLHKPDHAYLILRIVLGVLIGMHGIAKLSKGVTGIEGMLTGAGVPAFIAYGVYIGELVAPALLILGLFVAPAALIIAFNMVVAIALAHSGQVFDLSKNGGLALELQYLFLTCSVVVALLAPPRKVKPFA